MVKVSHGVFARQKVCTFSILNDFRALFFFMCCSDEKADISFRPLCVFILFIYVLKAADFKLINIVFDQMHTKQI